MIMWLLAPTVYIACSSGLLFTLSAQVVALAVELFSLRV